MRSFPFVRARRRARAGAVAALVFAALGLSATAAHADPAIPALTDGYGLTQVGTPAGTPGNFVVTVNTPQVSGPQNIRIVLPTDYFTAPTKHYPVFYLLHGAPDDPVNMTPDVLPALNGRDSMITVMPDGGERGWYSNWVNQNTAAGAQNWRNFHLDQVIPFIDANLRTIPTKQGRAIGGISMGGFGALRYVQDNPHLFRDVATFSGLLNMELVIARGAVAASATNIGHVLLQSCGGPCFPDFGPIVPANAILGQLFLPFLGPPANILAINPTSNMRKTEGVHVSLYTGTGSLELAAEPSANAAKASLDHLGYPYHFVNYGNGAGFGDGSCDGGHNRFCWNQALLDHLPRLELAFSS
ncbi:esterase [Actinocorallia sp. API 0066]|uniref:alpha/beta hydrolase n=1 Tax=Actinocorallia sp. API 0066 TaxID=2896846 RepID=UPI001E2DF7DB|nr:alpha/beta hydrolase-fold protein [Actinocorallia sp. API 0066]MCD0453516.1 esterase [Actinocorallia sp. API 0066]